jgi:hypothetical protein
MKFIAVIGQRNAGKSTIIRALTACKTVGFRGRVEDGKTNEWIEVIASSPQERDMPDLATKMRKAANDPDCLGVVAALQPDYRGKRICMEGVFEIAQKCHAKCYAFIISQPYDEERARGVSLTKVTTRLTEFRIRLAKPIHPLDARRFAHLNAAEIQKIANLFKLL